MSRYYSGSLILLLSLLIFDITHAAVSVDTNPSYEYRTFATCQEFEDTFKKILPTTYDTGIFYRGGMPMMEATVAVAPPTASKLDSSVPKSDTNVQVK